MRSIPTLHSNTQRTLEVGNNLARRPAKSVLALSDEKGDQFHALLAHAASGLQGHREELVALNSRELLVLGDLLRLSSNSKSQWLLRSLTNIGTPKRVYNSNVSFSLNDVSDLGFAHFHCPKTPGFASKDNGISKGTIRNFTML